MKDKKRLVVIVLFTIATILTLIINSHFELITQHDSTGQIDSIAINNVVNTIFSFHPISLLSVILFIIQLCMIQTYIKRAFYIKASLAAFALILSILPMFYVCPYKINFSLNDSELNEIIISTHYLFPHKNKIQSYPFNSDDTLLIHLWKPMTSGSDDLSPSGQIFLINDKQKRIELYEGLYYIAENTGKSLHKMTGLAATILNYKGYSSIPFSKRTIAANHLHIENNKYYLNGILLKSIQLNKKSNSFNLSFDKIKLNNWDSAAIEFKNK